MQSIQQQYNKFKKENTPMNTKTFLWVLTTALASAIAFSPATSNANTHSNASEIISTASPIASVVLASAITTSVVSDAVAVVPASLKTAGTLVIKGIEQTVKGVLYVLQGASDATQFSLLVATESTSLVVGSTLTVSVVETGTILSSADEVVAFLPNSSGEILFHNEKIIDENLPVQTSTSTSNTTPDTRN